MPSSRLRLPFATLAALLALGAVPATAQDGPIQPGCAGLAAEDEEGDARRFEGGGDAPDNFDATGVFFTYAGGKTYANLRTMAGGSDLPPGASGARWYVYWTAGGKERFVRAEINNLGEPIFRYGETTTNPATGQTQFSPIAETTGKFNEGSPGVLQMLIPPEVGGVAGTELSGPRGETFDVVGNQLFAIDAAPNDGGGEPYVVNGCESGGSAPPPGPPAPPAPPAPPSGSGGGSGGEGGGGAGPPATAPVESAAQPGTLAVKVAKTTVKAKGRTLRLALTSAGTITGLKATLLSGAPKKPKAVGRGSLARVARKGTLRLTLSRKLKKGRYLLSLTGTNPDGRGATLNVNLRLR